MKTNLKRIKAKAEAEPALVFTNLYHHITDKEHLRECYRELSGKKAAGIDRVTKEEYGKNLEVNLTELSERLKRNGYRPQPARRAYLPKDGSAKGRPLAEDKTRRIEFGRYAEENARKKGKGPEVFDFLGFTHYCGHTRNGYFKLKRRTRRKSFLKSVRRFSEWAQSHYGRSTRAEMIKVAMAKVKGHLNYFAITDNSQRCTSYLYQVSRILYKWLNRKSQRYTYCWDGFLTAIRQAGWPSPKVRVRLALMDAIAC